EDHQVRVWDGSLLRTFRGHNHRVQSVAFSSDGRHVASASLDWTVKLWKIDADQEYRSFLRQDAPVLGARFSQDGRRLANAAQDGTVRLWDVESGKLLQQQK